MSLTREQAEACTILRGTVGSTVHGLHIEDGLEDRDEMGVCLEPIEAAMGVYAPFEQFIYRSAAEREGRHDAPSQGGDLDLTIYSLRKYMRLALKGNPTVIQLLFVPPDKLQTGDARGFQLRELAPYIVSRRAGVAYLGYLHAQRQRLLGERGNGGHGQPRRGLVDKFGFDVKYAMHMLRLGIQGVELLSTGRLTLPIAEPERAWLFGVRQGKESIDICLTRAGELEKELRDLVTTSPIRDEPDIPIVEDWMVRIYFRAWSATRKTRDIAEDAARWARAESAMAFDAVASSDESGKADDVRKV